MEKRLHKTDLGTITYWISYASDTEAGVAVQEDSCADTAEELTFEPDAAASVTSARLNQSMHKMRIPEAPWLVFLPGLSADHRLFNRQLSYFAETMNCFVWDPPAHGKSRPFKLSFSMDDLASMLHEILLAEQIVNPILIGQSMGGYVSQAFLSLFPGYAKGFISIDSAPLARS